jgi:adenylyltransferase/sulfurtransferase
MDRIEFLGQAEGRYDRHQLITWWEQKRVSQANVIVAGAGALGNEVLKLLALIGVGQIILVDFDKISTSNLARMVLFREEDIGRSKAEVAAERLHEINPDVVVTAIHGDLRIDLGLGEFRSADLVFGCLDSVNARWALNRKCMLAGVEWIDGAISDFHGSIARYSPSSGACYECNFTQQTYKRFNQRYSCPFGLVSDLEEIKVPTTAVTTSVIAAIQVQQALMMLHNIEEGLQPGERLMVYLKPYGMIKDILPYNSECLAHFTIPAETPIVDRNTNITLRESMQIAQTYLPDINNVSLPFDFIAGFTCSECNTREEIMRAKEKVFQAQAVCPNCGQLRTPEVINVIDLASPYLDLKLSGLGIPEREILKFNGNGQSIYLQFGT